MNDILSSWINKQIYWRPEFADDDEHPPKIDDCTYQTSPYLIFVKADDETVHLISDGTLDLIVTLDNSSPNASKTSFKIAPLQSGDAGDWADARIDIDADNMLQFRIRGTSASSELQAERYVPLKHRTDELAPQAQVLDDYFTHTGSQFYKVQTGFDVTKLTLENPGAHHCLNIFIFPNGSTRKYKAYGEHVIPWGWRYTGLSQGFAEKQRTVITNTGELNASAKKTFGSKFSAGLEGVNLSLTNSENDTSLVEAMQERELTLITSANTWVSYAAVLDKANVQLSDVFYQALCDLQEDLAGGGPSDASFANFCSRVGTHYANAVTFGSKVYLVATCTNQQIVQLVNQGVDVSAGLDFGVSGSASAAGLPISESEKIELNNETAQENNKKLSSILQIGKDDIIAIGGHSGDQATDSNLVPVMLDLRPISDLLAPPFFNDLNIIGLDPQSLRSQLANYIQSYAYYKIDAQGERIARLHRLTYKSNRIVQCRDAGGPNFPPTETMSYGGVVSVKDTALFNFSLFAGSQQLKEVFRLHDSLLVTADQVRVTVEVPIIQYLTVLGIQIPPEKIHRSMEFFPLDIDLYRNNAGYSIDDERTHYQQTGGMARPYSFTVDIKSKQEECEQILPWLCLLGDFEPALLCGWATFTVTPVETAKALFSSPELD
jgi:hypothetical protein